VLIGRGIVVAVTLLALTWCGRLLIWRLAVFLILISIGVKLTGVLVMHRACGIQRPFAVSDYDEWDEDVGAATRLAFTPVLIT
tara:strand:+ start:74 stop:322 length:249 start_codon:yes stop_codon:yes gene_type:complete